MKLTPYLEKLVWTGKAQVKTFTAGAQKCVINVPESHFIIILRFDHFPFIPVKMNDTDLEAINAQIVTQMRIFSDKSYSNFVIRNHITQALTTDTVGNLVPCWNAGQPYSKDVYLVHETDVSISFSKAPAPTTSVSAIPPTPTPARPVPSDYGKVGFAGSIQVGTVRALGVNQEYKALGKFTPSTAGATWSVDSLEFPIDNTTRLQSAEIDQNSQAYPLANFDYLLIKGRPADFNPTT